VEENERPLDEARVVSIVRRETPEVIISGAEPITARVLAASDRLRMVMKHGVGVDNIDLNAATSRGVVVANAPGTNTEAVADLTLGLILTSLRGICAANESTHSGGWERYVGHQLSGLTVGIIGTGRVGAAVARRVHAFGGSLLGYDVIENEELARNFGLHYVPLAELLESSDIVTLHAPLTPPTERMIGERELSKMKRSAILINTARGELVDEAALTRHLKAGRIAGAAVDVFSTEPPQDSPLLDVENVIATPHIGAYTYEAMETMDRLCAETIIGVLCEDKHPPNLLNPEVVR
jgi:D-3-phosphoglycerate dehydrogenase